MQKFRYIFFSLLLIFVLNIEGFADTSKVHKSMLSYNTPVKYSLHEPLNFEKFSIELKKVDTNFFDMGGVQRSRTDQIFEIKRRDQTTIERHYSFGFPGGLVPGFGFIIARRDFVNIEIRSASESGGILTALESESAIEPDHTNPTNTPHYITRKKAEYGSVYSVEAPRNVLEFPDFDLIYSGSLKRIVNLTAQSKAEVRRKTLDTYKKLGVELTPTVKNSIEESLRGEHYQHIEKFIIVKDQISTGVDFEVGRSTSAKFRIGKLKGKMEIISPAMQTPIDIRIIETEVEG